MAASIVSSRAPAQQPRVKKCHCIRIRKNIHTTRRLFVPTRDKNLLVLHADTGKIIANFPIGAGTDAVKFDPGLKLVFASGGDGTLTVVREESEDKFTLVLEP